MKKIESLGKTLTHEDQKQIKGGSQIVCVCTGGTNHGLAVFCVGSIISCSISSLQTCGGNATCDGTVK